jgi:fumarate hydratase class II
MGEIAVPADRYWGAQTQRSLQNLRIGGERMPVPLTRALGLVKQAAAETNMRLGVLDRNLGEAIAEAAAEWWPARSTSTSPWWSGRPAPAPRPT